MSADDRQGIPTRIEAAVRSVPGVTAVYSAGSLAMRIADAGARLLGVRDGAVPLVRVEEDAEGLRVEVAIGVRAAGGAGLVARAVHAAIRAVVDEPDRPHPVVRLTVVHVDEDPAEVDGEGRAVRG